MSEKYIRKNKNSYKIIKNSRVFGKFDSLDDAIFVREILINNNWDIDNFTLEMHLSLDNYIPVSKIDEKLVILGKFKDKPNDKLIEKLTKKRIRNPNNSKYGLNIVKVFDLFMVKKQIAGDEYVFGVFDNLDDAIFTRNFLLDNNWNVEAFKEVEYCDESETYKIVKVYDDRVYILATFKSRSDALNNIENSKSEFLNKITKHKHGLANHPHLDALTEHIEDLENEFHITTEDDVWNFSEVNDPLSEIIFNLTPWQKIIYDEISDEFAFDDLVQSLSRYKTKNFDKKVKRYLDELVDLGLVEKLDDKNYRKI